MYISRETKKSTFCINLDRVICVELQNETMEIRFLYGRGDMTVTAFETEDAYRKACDFVNGNLELKNKIELKKLEEKTYSFSLFSFFIGSISTIIVAIIINLAKGLLR